MKRNIIIWREKDENPFLCAASNYLLKIYVSADNGVMLSSFLLKAKIEGGSRRGCCWSIDMLATGR